LADIFLSYSRTDKPRVAPLVAALEAKGWDVWWDMALVAGEEFDNVTAAALETARSVVVVWTPTSVASRWVRGEARVGADRNVLAPVRFDAAQLPIDLRAIQTTDMDDWGGDPQSAQFQALHQSLLAMLGAPAKAGAPCVGRGPELERVRELLGKSKRGEGGFLLFSGEAGVGKSRMIQEAERMAIDAGFNVLKGHCANTESPPPFQPALEQIEQTARRLGPDLMRQSMGDNAAEICRLMPELKQRYSDIPEYPILPPEQERRYLLHGIAEFVARGAARQPLVLVFEDLHWADESTCVLLAYVADRLKNDPVLMIGAYRDSEVGDAPFGRTLQELVRKRLAEDLRLRRLTSAHIVELLARQFGSEPPASLVELIFSKTEGNPFFVEEVVRHLVDADKLLTEGGKFRDRIEVTDAEVTRGVRFILEDRIGPVGTPCRDVMTIAAVIGRTFAFELLAKTDSARSEDEVLDAVEEAERKHLIEDVSREREARYRFVHEQVRQTLIAGLSLPRRQRLHLRIANALEARFGAHAEKVAGEIGHHLYQAGSAADPARTAQHLGIAGDKGIQALAFEDALRQFDLALKVLEDGGDGAGRAKLHSQRAVALRGAERFAEALDALSQAVAAAPTQEAKDAYALERCQLLLGIWRGAEAIGDLEALLARAKASGDPARALSVQRVVARAYYVMSLDHKPYTDKCRDAYEQAISLARAQNDKAALGASLVATAQFTDYWPEFRSQAEQNLAEAATIARETADEDLDLDVATALLSISWSGRDIDDEERILARLLTRRDPIRLNAFYFRMMWSTYGNGRLTRCTEICDAGIELAYRIGTLPVQYPTIKGFALIELGRFGDAWASFDKEIADSAHRFGAAIRDLGRMHYALQVGAHEEAIARAKHVTVESHALSRAWMLKWIAQDLADLAFDYAGDAAMIARIEELIAATGARLGAIGAAALNIAKGDYGAAAALQDVSKGHDWIATTRLEIMRAQILAHLAAAQGDHAKARDWLNKAVSRARDTGAEHRLWRALGELALIEEAMGDKGSAATREEAQAVWTKVGATIPDMEHRAAFMRGLIACRLGLSKATQGSGGPQ
jgi:tetratricopeptide (TPR) repeat protein